MTSIRSGVGTSENDDAAIAGRSSATDAIAGLDHRPAALIMVFASVRYDLTRLIAGIREVTGSTPLVGASSNGHFHNGRATPPAAGVAVLALSAGPYQFGVGSIAGVRDNAFESGRDLARAARAAVSSDQRGPYTALLLLTDGIAGNQQALLSGTHKVIGAGVPIVGGVAGDDRNLTRTYVFDGDRVLDTGGAVAVWISSPWPLTVAAGHGWHPISPPMLVTKVEGNVVHEVAGRPALDLFREHLHPDQTGQQLGWGWVRRPGCHSAHAFGLIEPDGRQLIRGAYLDDDGQLRTFDPMPSYSAVQIVTCRADDLLDVTDGVVRRATSGRDPTVLLAFSCVARLDILQQEHASAEAGRLQQAAGDITTFGFYTYGEFARTGRVAGYHNASLAAIAL
jgi:hypothetical protein